MSTQAGNSEKHNLSSVAVIAESAECTDPSSANCAVDTRLKNFSQQPSRQGGVALVVAIILLIVITLMGLAAVRGTIMQQKMTSNFYDRQLAFQAAEAALRQAEAAVQAATAPGPFLDCSSNATTPISCLADPTNDPKVPASSIIQVLPASFAQIAAAGSPQYVIEYMGYFAVPQPKAKQISNTTSYGASSTTFAYFYRITAWSGPTTTQDRAAVMLQSYFTR